MNQPPAGGYPQGYGYPSGAPAPGGRPGKVRPGRVWYLVALALLAGGVAWLVLSFTSFLHQIDSMPRAPLPQGGQVSLTQTGGYVIYYEGPGATSGNLPSVNVRIAPASPGAAVGAPRPYGSPNTSLTYSVGSHHGRAVLTLQVRHPGTFSVRTVGGSTGSDLAFGPSFAGTIVRGLLGGLLLVLLGFALALTILIIRIVKRSRQRAQQAAGWS